MQDTRTKWIYASGKRARIISLSFFLSFIHSSIFSECCILVRTVAFAATLGMRWEIYHRWDTSPSQDITHPHIHTYSQLGAIESFQSSFWHVFGRFWMKKTKISSLFWGKFTSLFSTSTFRNKQFFSFLCLKQCTQLS